MVEPNSIPEAPTITAGALEAESRDREAARRQLTSDFEAALLRFREVVEAGRPLIHVDDEPEREIRDRFYGHFLGSVLNVVRSVLSQYPECGDGYPAASETAIRSAYTLLDHAHLLALRPQADLWTPPWCAHGHLDDTLARIEKVHHTLHDAELLRSNLQISALKTLDHYRPSWEAEGQREVLEDVLQRLPEAARQYAAEKLEQKPYVPFQSMWLAGYGKHQGYFAETLEEFVGACLVADLRALLPRSPAAAIVAPARTAEEERPIYRLAHQALMSWDRGRGRPRQGSVQLPRRFEAANALLVALGMGAASAEALERTWNARNKSRDAESGF